MRPIMLALVLSLLSGSHSLAQGYPPLVRAPWWQLCGNNRSLPFDPHFACCCFIRVTGKHCVRRNNAPGDLLSCVYICNAAPCT
jgi:hypothetical protein